MTKEGEDVTSATRSSQDLAEKVSKSCRYVRWGLIGVGSESDKHDLIMFRRRGHVQRDRWRNGYGFVVKVRNVVYNKEPLQ